MFVLFLPEDRLLSLTCGFFQSFAWETLDELLNFCAGDPLAFLLGAICQRLSPHGKGTGWPAQVGWGQISQVLGTCWKPFRAFTKATFLLQSGAFSLTDT